MSRGGGRGGGRGGRGRSAPGAGQVLIRETQIDLGMDKIGPDQVGSVYSNTAVACGEKKYFLARGKPLIFFELIIGPRLLLCTTSRIMPCFYVRGSMKHLQQS